MISARAITGALRELFPQVTMSTRSWAGGWTVTLPATCAAQLGITRDGDPAFASGWLTRHLGEPVHVAGVSYPRRDIRHGPRAAVSIHPGAACGRRER